MIIAGEKYDCNECKYECFSCEEEPCHSCWILDDYPLAGYKINFKPIKKSKRRSKLNSRNRKAQPRIR